MGNKKVIFNSLHHHTTFSYQDGHGTPEQHISRVADLGMGSLALTEHGNVTSHVRLEQAANKAGVKPIFGVELYCGPVEEDKRQQKKNHLTVLAENQDGYKNLLQMVSRGWSEGFYYEPTVSGSMLSQHKNGLIVLSGCSGSLLSTSLIGGKNIDKKDANYTRALQVAKRFKHALRDAYYLEVQAFPELEQTRNINKGLAEISEQLQIPLVATLDVHYTRPEESEIQAILHNVRGGHRQTLEEQSRDWGYDVKLCVPITDAVIFRRLVATGLTRKQAEAAIKNTKEIADRCNVVLPKIEPLHYPLPPDADSTSGLFRRWIHDGITYRGMGHLFDPFEDIESEYEKRLNHEMEMIENKNFADYFLIVSDLVQFAKRNNIPVGPARGSAAASLVCYLLRITEVDPIKFPMLLFERFIDINRNDLPDIDLDFDDERRSEVIEYAVAKYGADRVGNIGTFTRYKGRNALDDVARALRLPQGPVERVKNLLVERIAGDKRPTTIKDTVAQIKEVREIFDKYPELWKAAQLEGNLRGFSVHAAGLVIANEPLTNACAIYTREDKESKTEVVSLDKYDAEYLNVLKIDLLGLKTMSMIRLSLAEIGMSLEELYAVPLDDEVTLSGFRNNDVVGIFQFDGQSLQHLNSSLKSDNFLEICHANALVRPGSLYGGATAAYIDVKYGREEPKHWHPIVDKITEYSRYQIVYQEQIMQIVRDLAGFEPEDVTKIRTIVAKSKGEAAFNAYRLQFAKGAAKHDMSKEDAGAVFDMMASAGGYAFNAAHCISYGTLAYWTMYLKQHFPEAFYIGALRKADTTKKKNKVVYLLQDVRRHNIPIKAPDLNTSVESWSMDGKVLRAGFEQIPGIGGKTAQAIIDNREKIPFDNWNDIQRIKGIGAVTVGKIKDFVFDEDPFELDALGKRIKAGKRLIRKTPQLPKPTHTSVQVPYDRSRKDTSIVWIGAVKERKLRDIFESHKQKTGEDLNPDDVKDPHLRESVTMFCEDEEGQVAVVIDRWRYYRMKRQIWDINVDDDVILVRGLKKSYQMRRAIMVSEMWVIAK